MAKNEGFAVWRQAMGNLSKYKAAYLLGVDATTIRRWENGGKLVPFHTAQMMTLRVQGMPIEDIEPWPECPGQARKLLAKIVTARKSSAGSSPAGQIPQVDQPRAAKPPQARRPQAAELQVAPLFSGLLRKLRAKV
jgi:hypothetical protein